MKIVVAGLASLALLASCSSTTSSSTSGADAGAHDAGAPGVCGGSLTGGELGPTLTFVMKAPGGYCAGRPSGCDATWLSILDADGHALPLSSNCTAECSSCEPLGCPAICPIPSPVPSEGASGAWEGRIFAPSTCTMAQGGSLSCVDPQCAPAGTYVARMCAFPGKGGDAGSEPCDLASNDVKVTCVDVPFEWPSSGPITGTIAP